MRLRCSWTIGSQFINQFPWNADAPVHLQSALWPTEFQHEMCNPTDQSTASEPSTNLADALIHLLSCLAMSFVFVPYGFKLSERGDFTTAKTYHAGGILMVAGVCLLFVAIGGLGWLPTGRWRSWRQPLALACWVLAGALFVGFLQVCSNGTYCTGSAWDLSIDILTWTWLPAFCSVKWLLDLFMDKRNPSLK